MVAFVPVMADEATAEMTGGAMVVNVRSPDVASMPSEFFDLTR